MLAHHANTTGNTTTSIARLLSHHRNAVPEGLLLQIFSRLSHPTPLDRIPRYLEKTISRLTQLFNGKNLTQDPPRFYRTFESFLLGSFPQNSFIVDLSLPEVGRLRATACLEIMARELRFNICQISSSFLRNKDLANSSATVEARVSSNLRYACRHWAEHVSGLETLDVDLLRMLSGFFQTHFLHWLEVMSILALSPVNVLKHLVAMDVCNSLIFATMI